MSVKHWLESLSLSQYLESFLSHGFDSLAKCATVTDADLDRIGVTLPGHKKRVLSHLKTAQDFSVAKAESADQSQSLVLEEIQIPKDSCCTEVSDLIDLQLPDYINVTREEAKHFPIDLPPKIRRKDIDDLLGPSSKPDAGVDADKKKPIPFPRRSVHFSQTGDMPVPKPRTKKPAACEIQESAGGDSLKDARADSRPNHEEQKSLGSEVKPDAGVTCLQPGKDAEKITEAAGKAEESDSQLNRGENVVYAEVEFVEGNPPSSSDRKAQQNFPDSNRKLKQESECISRMVPLSECLSSEAGSPSITSDVGPLLSPNYEGDVEDEEINDGYEYSHGKQFRSEAKVDVSEISNKSASGLDMYTGVWNMNSGKTTGQRRSEIKSDISIPEFSGSEGEDDGIEMKVPNKRASPIVPKPSSLDVPVPSRPELPLPPAPKHNLVFPPIPARKLDLKYGTTSTDQTNLDPSHPAMARQVESNNKPNSFDVVEEVEEEEVLSPWQPMTSTPVLKTSEPPGEGVIVRPPLPLRPAPLPPNTSTDKDSSPQPQLPNEPSMPAGGANKGKMSHPCFPTPLSRSVPVPLVGLTTSAAPPPPTVLPPTRADSLDVEVPIQPPIPTPPARNLPPRPPPKVGIPSYSSNDENYFLAKSLEEDDLTDETEVPGDASFTESDDTLSDGGEFYDIGFRRPSVDVLRQSIPIIPSTSITARQTSRKGFLHKLTSKTKKLTKLSPPWQKRWVVFDSLELRYFSSNKSFVSKRIIPVCTMVTVETDIRTGDLHQYCFKLKSVDRVYTFAADDVDDMAWWANIIMQAIIQNRSERESFVEGGDMSSPDIQGYVRMEGSKSKRYLVVKKAKFCFYNTHNDFKSFTPIHRVEMQLASVKDVGRFKLQLHTPHVAFMLIFESQDEVNQWKDVFEDSILQGLGDDSVINEVYMNHSNRFCADCDMPDPEWASISLGITLCKFCAGIHRSLPWSKVRSLRMDSKVWKPSVRQLLLTIGNDNSNTFWEWTATEDVKIDSKADLAKRKDFILRKYSSKLYCHFHPFRGQQNSLNEALCKMVQFGNVLETLELVFSGADILCTKNNETPIQLAKKAKQVLQEEFLYQNGGDQEAAQSLSPGAASRNAGICHRGFLFKTGSNVKGEFLRRWCTLENGVFSYFDTDKSTVANDSIEKSDMQSVGLTVDDRYDYTFEVGTKKQGGRVFLFAAESNEDRMQWVTKLAKVMSNMPPGDLEKIEEVDRGGRVFARWGTTSEWESTWAQISHKTLKIFSLKERSFEEADLRKAKSISFRNTSERCVESFDEGPPFVVDLRTASYLYIQGDLKSETDRWFSAIQKSMMETGRNIANQSLTSDNVPVIIEKCISFIALYGLEVEGIYRLNGQHSKVTRLLENFMADACSMLLKPEEFQVHDVANALKRFFRTLEEPLLTYKLYDKWIETTGLTDVAVKLRWYKYLLKELPVINYCTLKHTITHLARVAELERVNKMSITNLASIFGVVMMRLDQDLQPNSSNAGFSSTNSEISVAKDLLENHLWLFEVKEEELEQEKKIEEARRKIRDLNSQSSENQVQQMQDVIIGVHVISKDGDIISLKVSVQMRVEELQNYVIEKAKLDADCCWSLFEVICNGELERPLHYREGVIDVTLRWMTWPMEFCRDNYLCLKQNYVYEKIELLDDPHPSMFCELRYSSKKGFHKYCFEFSRYCLTYRTHPKASGPTASWNIEDLIIYLGCQRQRSPPSKWCFSFICVGEQLSSPFFGHCISCSNEEELYRWLSVMFRAQRPEGLFSSALPRGVNTASTSSSQLRPPGVAGAAQEATSSETSKSRWLKSSFLQKFNLK